MFFHVILLFASSVTFLSIHQVSSSDPNCTDYPVFTPSSLVVKYGDPANATCVVCQKDCNVEHFGLEKAVGEVTENGTTLLWTVDRMTEWDTSVMCYYNPYIGDQCSSTLNVTVYQPPESVSISFVNHNGPMFENHQYTLQCVVQNVAPVQNLSVTFYRGHTALSYLQSNSEPQKKPVSETFTLNITPSKEDDGAQYWCEAKLELGPDGPQPPPVETSEKLNTTIYFKTTTTRQSTTTTTKPTTSSVTTATTTTTAITAQTSTEPNSSSNSKLTHRFMCLMLLFSALI